MIVGVVRETGEKERRVAVTPNVLPAFKKLGLDVVVEKGAGEGAGFPDDAYQKHEARIVDDANGVASADILLIVSADGFAQRLAENADFVREGQTVIGLLDPFGNPQLAETLAHKRVTSFALERLPRISRAQSMDALTSMATIAGYKAVLLAAGAMNKMFPLMMTAAGTITPAHVFVIGAGVAGLQAIATARRLGAVVHAYDVRPVVREQVESLGAKFVEMELETKEAETKGGYAQEMGEEFYKKQRELMAQTVVSQDAVITTAAIPGKKAPVLITKEMVQSMPNGSVIVDLAAATGGNCEHTKANETIHVDGVTIMGPTNLPATIPYHASQMYARNLAAFLKILIKDGKLELNRDDEIIRDSLYTHEGEVISR